MADGIRKKRDQSNDASTTSNLDFPAIGAQCITRFLRRHPKLSKVQIPQMDAARVKDASFEQLSKWFMNLEMVVKEYNILPENRYNMDESGFAIGEVEPSKCIINAEI